MEDKPLERWHGAHHYSDRLHWLLVVFLFLTAGTIIWSYSVFNDSRFTYKNNPAPSASPTPVASCTPRPSCLDSQPRCLMPETDDMCPPSASPKPTDNQVFCTQEAKRCPDGSYVGRSGPNCEFAPCPTGKQIFCGGIAGASCPTGYSCKLDGSYPDAGGTCIRTSPR